MDEELKALIDTHAEPAMAGRAGRPTALDVTFRFSDRVAGTVQVTAGEMIHNYTLKPLSQLYGTGTGLESVEGGADAFMPLLMSIGEVFVHAATDPRVTDSTVAFALERSNGCACPPRPTSPTTPSPARCSDSCG